MMPTDHRSSSLSTDGSRMNWLMSISSLTSLCERW